MRVMYTKAGFLIRLGVTLVIGAILAGCRDKVVVQPLNTPPRLAGDSTVVAAADEPFRYVARVTDPDGPDTTVTFSAYPTWLAAAGDTLFGSPPLGAVDTSFHVSVSDGLSADTLVVQISLAPIIAFYGDSRTNHTVHRQVAARLVQSRPVAVFHSGDLVDNGTVASLWDTFNVVTSDLRAAAPFYPALGNHEYQSQLYFDNFELPGNEQWYTVMIGRICVIVLNSCVATGIGSEQYQWLSSTLAGIPDSIERVTAVFHHPPYSTGQHTEDEMQLRSSWVPLFEQYGVDLVFTGHDHDYERSECGGLTYIVTGGGGAPLYDQTRQHPCSRLFLKRYHMCTIAVLPDRLVGHVYSTDGSVIDRFELTSP